MSQTYSSTVRTGSQVTPMAALHVEVIADLICPFCFLGKRRLDRAMSAVKGPAETSWYPYQLNPDMPEEGMPYDDYLLRRFGGPASIQPVLDSLVAQGREVDIEFHFDKIRHVPNTLPAHQLMHLAASEGVDQTALADDLMHAFFECGDNIGDTGVLLRLAKRHGLPADAVDRVASDDKTREIVLAREAQVRSSGMSGVPGFLLNRRLLVVGAQSTDTLINAFDRAMFGEGDDEPANPAAVH